MYIETQLIKSTIVTVTQTFDIIDTIPVAQSLPSNPDARFYMRVTAQGGTSSPTLTLTVNGMFKFTTRVAATGAIVPFAVGGLTAITGDGDTTEELTNVPRHIQISAVVTGTDPTFTLEMWMTR